MGEIFGVYALKVGCILLGMYFLFIAGFYIVKYRNRKVKKELSEYRGDLLQIIIWLVILTIIVLTLAISHFEVILHG